jgi:hypothetical protein
MPFDPIRTDEKLEKPVKKKTDFEAHLMTGCMVICISSFLVLGLAVWPFFTFEEHTVDGLKQISLFGLTPAVVFGGIVAYRFGLAGSSGMIGGAMTAAIFMYLKLAQTAIGKDVVDLPAPEYPVRWAWMLPLVFLLVAATVGLFSSSISPASDLAKRIDR